MAEQVLLCRTLKDSGPLMLSLGGAPSWPSDVSKCLVPATMAVAPFQLSERAASQAQIHPFDACKSQITPAFGFATLYGNFASRNVPTESRCKICGQKGACTRLSLLLVPT